VAVRDGTPLLSELLRTHRVNHAAYVSINVFAACLLMNDTEVARYAAHDILQSSLTPAYHAYLNAKRYWGEHMPIPIPAPSAR